MIDPRRSPAAAILGLLLAACAGPELTHTAASNALGPYSAAVESAGLVFLAGKVGRDRATFETEVDSAITAVEDELRRLGLSLADVCSVNVFVTDIARYADVNAIYARRFANPYPARTFVAVDGLPGGAAIELQAIAARR